VSVGANPDIARGDQDCTRPTPGPEWTTTEIESMNRSFLLRASALAVLLTAAAGDARAQSGADGITETPRLRYSLGGGIADSPPFGGSGPASSLGYHLTGAAELRTRWSPLRLRADGLFAQWGNDQRVSALTGGLVVRAPERWRAAPFLLGGAGGYASRGGGIARGWNLGAGLRVPLGVRAIIVESRMHAFDVGEGGLARSGTSLANPAYNRWQYTYMPLSFSLQF
jgi:hypothetical protein